MSILNNNYIPISNRFECLQESFQNSISVIHKKKVSRNEKKKESVENDTNRERNQHSEVSNSDTFGWTEIKRNKERKIKWAKKILEEEKMLEEKKKSEAKQRAEGRIEQNGIFYKEILLQIFGFCDGKTLGKCLCVCKSWKLLIDIHPELWENLGERAGYHFREDNPYSGTYLEDHLIHYSLWFKYYVSVELEFKAWYKFQKNRRTLERGYFHYNIFINQNYIYESSVNKMVNFSKPF